MVKFLIFGREDGKSGKCPVGEMSDWETVWQGNFAVGELYFGNSLSENGPVGKLSGYPIKSATYKEL